MALSRWMAFLSSGVLLTQAVNSRGLGAQIAGDRAAVRVVRYARTAVPMQRWTIDAKPLLEIGGVDGQGPSEFAEIRGVVRLQDGRIAVANGATNEIRIFSKSGAFQSSGGRAGSGPGEFRRLLRLFQFGDTLLGVDADTRVQLFTADGRLVRSGRPAHVEGSRNPQRVGVLRDGSTIVVATKGTQQRPTGEVMYLYSVYRSTFEGDSLAPLFEFPGYREVRVGQAPSRLPLDGEGTVTARDRRICAGFSSRFDVTCYDASGTGIIRIVREIEARAPTDSDRSVVRNAYLAANRDAPPRIREQMERAVQEFRFADRVPAFSRLLISSNGELWVSEFDPSTNLPGPSALLAPRRSQRWSVFSPDGAWLADVLLPERFIAHDIGRDYVAGVSFDSDDVERVTVWRIRR
jgi:hypothetical protein